MVEGKEFVIFCQDSLAGAYVLAERLRQIIQSTPFVYNGNAIKVTASFGVSSVADKTSLYEAIACADKMLYKAKRDDRNRVEVMLSISTQRT